MFEQGKSVMNRYFEAWNARDLDAFDEIFASDAIDHDAQNPFADVPGPAGAKRVAEMYFAAFSDGRFEARADRRGRRCRHALDREGDE